MVDAMICGTCGVRRDVTEFRWDNEKEGHCRKRARFDAAVGDGRIPDATDCTKTCRTCRDRRGSSNAPYARRMQMCRDWYRSQLTACADCSERRPECLGLFLIDPDGEPSVRSLSCHAHWAAAARGVDGMMRVRTRFEVYCFFCHSAHHHRHDTGTATDFDRWLHERMRDAAACAECGRATSDETLRGFQFAHHNSATKTVHSTLGPLSMMTLRIAVRNNALSPSEATALADEEWSRGRVLCHNCHRMETRVRTGV